MIPVMSDYQRHLIEPMIDLLKSELNVKDIKLVSADEGVLIKRIKPDFKN